jgi:hypothetical protein
MIKPITIEMIAPVARIATDLSIRSVVLAVTF